MPAPAPVPAPATAPATAPDSEVAGLMARVAALETELVGERAGREAAEQRGERLREENVRLQVYHYVHVFFCTNKKSISAIFAMKKNDYCGQQVVILSKSNY